MPTASLNLENGAGSLSNGSLAAKGAGPSADAGARPNWPAKQASGRTRIKIALLHLAKAIGLFTVMRKLTGSGVRILCYHGIWLGDDGYAGDMMFMLPQTFERRLRLIRALGFPVISLAEAVDALTAKRPLPEAAIVITIDDGWYGTYQHMLPALRAHAMPATLYCDTAHLLSKKPIAHVLALYVEQFVTDPDRRARIEDDLKTAQDRKESVEQRLEAVRKVAKAISFDIEPYIERRCFDYMTPDELAEAAAQGIDVQLHTHNHTMHDLSADRIVSEIAQNREALARVLDKHPSQFRHFCYPSGVASHEAASVLGGLGIASSTTLERGVAFPGRDPQLLPRLLDGEQISDIEFEARLCGLTVLRSVWSKPPADDPSRAGSPDSPLL